MFKKDELQKIKEGLLLRKRELEEELDRLSNEKMTDNQSQDDGDQVVSVAMESLRNALQDTEYQEYKMILSSLKSIEQGTYGICQDCGKEISYERLKYNPNALYCLSCQEQREERDEYY